MRIQPLAVRLLRVNFVFSFIFNFSDETCDFEKLTKHYFAYFKSVDIVCKALSGDVRIDNVQDNGEFQLYRSRCMLFVSCCSCIFFQRVLGVGSLNLNEIANCDFRQILFLRVSVNILIVVFSISISGTQFGQISDIFRSVLLRIQMSVFQQDFMDRDGHQALLMS